VDALLERVFEDMNEHYFSRDMAMECGIVPNDKYVLNRASQPALAAAPAAAPSGINTLGAAPLLALSGPAPPPPPDMTEAEAEVCAVLLLPTTKARMARVLHRACAAVKAHLCLGIMESAVEKIARTATASHGLLPHAQGEHCAALRGW
jgi:hypothetical protein